MEKTSHETQFEPDFQQLIQEGLNPKPKFRILAHKTYLTGCAERGQDQRKSKRKNNTRGTPFVLVT